MSRWRLPKPDAVTEDSELWFVNILISTITLLAIDSIAPAGGTPREAHQLMLKLIRRGYENLLRTNSQLSEDGVEDLLDHLRRELP